MRDVYVACVAMIRFGRYPERDVPDLGAEAVLRALKDAGLSIKDVELMAAGCLFQANAIVGQRILQEVGQTGIRVVNVANACATGSPALPKARMVAYPNTLYMCCPTGDGAAAAVVVSPEKARQLGARVRVLASVLTSDPWTERDLTLPDVSTLTRNAARKAWELAGIGPEDLDLVELHDCFATAELLHYENLGLCKDGEAGRMIDEGETAHGGRIPVNVSGGLLSKGHPLGATGVAGIFEVTSHLRGSAGARQVEGAKVGLSHVIGLGSACTVNVLGL